jgi:hypothetical protein
MMETPNEARMDLNKPQVDDPEADELWAPVNMAPIGKAPAKVQKPVASPKVAPPGEGSGLLPGEPAPDEGSLGLGEPATNGKVKE